MNKKIAIENRIKKLEARTAKDNTAIVRKLKRQLNKINEMFTDEQQCCE